MRAISALAVGLIVVLSLCVCPSQGNSLSGYCPSKDATAILDEVWSAFSSIYPPLVSSNYTYFPEISPQAEQNHLGVFKTQLEKVERALKNHTHTNGTNYTDIASKNALLLARVTLLERIEAIEGNATSMDISQSNYFIGDLTGIYELLEAALRAREKTPSPEQIGSMKGLYADFPRYMDTLIAKINQSLAGGVVISKDEIKDLLPVVNLAASLDFSLVVTDHITPPDNEAITLSNNVTTTFKRLYDYLLDSLLPASERIRNDTMPGLAGLPGGTNMYRRALVKHLMGLNITPEYLHELGLNQTEELFNISLKHANNISGLFFNTSLEEQAWLRDSNNSFLYPWKNSSDIVDSLHSMYEKVLEHVGKEFTHVRTCQLSIRQCGDPGTPRGCTGMGGYYMPGKVKDDGSCEREGIFVVDFVSEERTDMHTFPKTLMGALFLHEGIPGHHFQTMLAQEQAAQTNCEHPLMTGLRTTAYTEGWALYAEKLGTNLGVYDDLYLVGWAQERMLRTMRLVVDTGLHALGWSRKRAKDYMMRNGGLSEDFIDAQLDRYIRDPGQATAYIVGAMRFEEGRKRAESELGIEFDPKKLHWDFVRYGAVVPSLIDDIVSNHIVCVNAHLWPDCY